MSLNTSYIKWRMWCEAVLEEIKNERKSPAKVLSVKCTELTVGSFPDVITIIIYALTWSASI